MARWSRTGWLGLLLVAAGAGSALAQDADVVRCAGSRGEQRGDISKEDYKGVEIKTSAGVQTIAWKDVLGVTYKGTPAAFAEAEKEYRARHYAKAAEGYREVYERAGKDKDVRDIFKQHAWFKMAQCYLLTRRYEDAITNFRELVRNFGEGKYVRESYLGLVRAALEKGDATGAKPLIESAKNAGTTVMKLGEEFEDYCKFFEAWRLELSKQYPEAMGSFNVSANSARSPAVQGESWVAWGRVQVEMGQPDGAEKTFRDGITKAPTAAGRAGCAGCLAELLLKRAEPTKNLALLHEAAFTCAQGIALNFPEPGELSDGYERSLYQAGLVYEALVAAAPKGKDKEADLKEFKDKSTAAFRELVSNYPDSAFAKQTKGR